MNRKFKIGDYFITTPIETNFGVITAITTLGYQVQWLRLHGTTVYNDFNEYDLSMERKVRKLSHEEAMLYILEV